MDKVPRGRAVLARGLQVLTCGLLLLTLLLVGCGTPVPLIPTPVPELLPAVESPLRLVCPESLLPALQAAAAAYRREGGTVEVSVFPRADALALRSIRQKDADIAVLTWIPEPLPEGAWMRPVARDGLAIVVNPQNGLHGVTMAQLRDLYRGRLEDWESWGGLPGPPQLVSREVSSGVSGYFQAWVMRDARVSLNALEAPSSEAMLAFVAEDSLAVGYVSSAWVDGRVRALAVDGVPPVGEAVAAGLYPLTRTHVVVTMAEPEGAQRDFVQWLLGEGGQRVLRAHGFLKGE
jgi:phosphate transport system substrate-binding protein